MNITIVGMGYVGLSNAILLAQFNKVTVLDISPEKVKMLNAKKSPINDADIEFFLTHKSLHLKASLITETAYSNANYIIVATPTNYNENTNCFDTSTVEDVIHDIKKTQTDATIVIKSTVPVGFTRNFCKKYGYSDVIFSPEFLREGKALYDNLNPSRIVVGDKSERAIVFANLLVDAANKKDVSILYTDSTEAEAIKLFSNTYLAMRVAFFNELDSYSIAMSLDTKDIINGVCLDKRIGNHYNNPSFGYGGYCLPKDTKQLLSNFESIPNRLIKAIVESNVIRKKFITNVILKSKPNVIGIYRLVMKSGSDNFRESAILDIIDEIISYEIPIVIYEPDFKSSRFKDCLILNDLKSFKDTSDVIIANRMLDDLDDVIHKVFTRDLFGRDI